MSLARGLQRSPERRRPTCWFRKPPPTSAMARKSTSAVSWRRSIGARVKAVDNTLVADGRHLLRAGAAAVSGAANTGGGGEEDRRASAAPRSMPTTSRSKAAGSGISTRSASMSPRRCRGVGAANAAAVANETTASVDAGREDQSPPAAPRSRRIGQLASICSRLRAPAVSPGSRRLLGRCHRQHDQGLCRGSNNVATAATLDAAGTTEVAATE